MTVLMPCQRASVPMKLTNRAGSSTDVRALGAKSSVSAPLGTTKTRRAPRARAASASAGVTPIVALLSRTWSVIETRSRPRTGRRSGPRRQDVRARSIELPDHRDPADLGPQDRGQRGEVAADVEDVGTVQAGHQPELHRGHVEQPADGAARTAADRGMEQAGPPAEPLEAPADAHDVGVAGLALGRQLARQVPEQRGPAGRAAVALSGHRQTPGRPPGGDRRARLRRTPGLRRRGPPRWAPIVPRRGARSWSPISATSASSVTGQTLPAAGHVVGVDHVPRSSAVPR